MDFIDYYTGNYTFDNDIDNLFEKLPSSVKYYMSHLFKRVKTLLALCCYRDSIFFICEHGIENHKLRMEFMIGNAQAAVEFTMMSSVEISIRIEFQRFKLMTTFTDYDTVVKVMDFFFDKSREYKGRAFPIDGEATYGNELRALTNDFGRNFPPRSR